MASGKPLDVVRLDIVRYSVHVFGVAVYAVCDIRGDTRSGDRSFDAWRNNSQEDQRKQITALEETLRSSSLFIADIS